MVAAVELLPQRGVLQPEVGTAVDDDGVVAERGRERTGLPVRQPEHDDVVAGQGLGRGGLEHPVGQRHQVGLQGAEGLPRVRAAGQGTDLDVGVAQQQPQHLSPGVPAGSGDRHAERHVHDYTCPGMFPGRGVSGVGPRD